MTKSEETLAYIKPVIDCFMGICAEEYDFYGEDAAPRLETFIEQAALFDFSQINVGNAGFYARLMQLADYLSVNSIPPRSVITRIVNSWRPILQRLEKDYRKYDMPAMIFAVIRSAFATSLNETYACALELKQVIEETKEGGIK